MTRISAPPSTTLDELLKNPFEDSLEPQWPSEEQPAIKLPEPKPGEAPSLSPSDRKDPMASSFDTIEAPAGPTKNPTRSGGNLEFPSPNSSYGSSRDAGMGELLPEPQGANEGEVTDPSADEFTLDGPRDRWWKPQVPVPQRQTDNALRVSLHALLVGALANSAEVQVISDAPLVAETDLILADAAFDWASFLGGRWDDLSDPVGNTLTTGGPDRLLDRNLTMRGGVRSTNRLGGEAQMGQVLGNQDTNSVFFVPNNQATTRMTMSYTQPLLRGAGRAYNTSLTVLAKIDVGIAQFEFERALQDKLLEITEAYWTLYRERGRLVVQKQHLERGRWVLHRLEDRQEVDALLSQIVRARSAVRTREADLVRARLAVKNAETNIRRLAMDPALGETVTTELIPIEEPMEYEVPIELSDSVAEALRNRPEISASLQQIKAAAVRVNMTKNEALPLLGIITETYVAGLEGNSNLGQAFNEQFTTGRPSYSLGMRYEMPFGNRAAKSQLQKRRIELRIRHEQYRATVAELKSEVEQAVYLVHSTHEELLAKSLAMQAAYEEVSRLRAQWELMPASNGSPSLLLQDLLDAQDGLFETERGTLDAAVSYNLSQVAYKRAIGQLLQLNQVGVARSCEFGLPKQHVFKGDEIGASTPAEIHLQARKKAVEPTASSHE